MTSAIPMTMAFALAAALLAGCEKPVSYTEDLQPILFASCLSCHDRESEGYLNSGFSLDSYESMMAGTKFGPVVVPGSSESSTLYLVVAHKTSPEIHMPPHTDDALAEGRGISLTEEQIDTVKRWIDQGALNN